MKKFCYVYGFLLVTIFKCQNISALMSSPIISTAIGRIQGVVSLAENGRPYYAFLGVPYARPPVGDLRFSPPVAAFQWDGIFNATKEGSPCSQRDIFNDPLMLLGSEDCLYLNIYKPKLTSKSVYPLPVMIWIHGGSWLWWSGTRKHFNPNRLMNKDLILVTINYRLGWLGFLSTEDDVVPGNNGLKDQAAAINWVNDNIEAFGGDRERITVAGQDTGAVSAHLHMYSPLSQGIISSVISQSGSAFAPSSISYPGEALSKATRLAEANACPNTTTTEMVACLRKLDAEQITTSDAMLYIWNGHPMVPLRPVVEGPVDGAFLVEHPEFAADNGDQAKIPMMIGTAQDEGAGITSAMMYDPTTLSTINENFRKIFPAIFVYEEYFSKEDKNKISDAIRNQYFKYTDISPKTVSYLQKAATTRLYKRPMNRIAQKQRLNNVIYLYQLNYRGSLSFSEIFGAGDQEMGVCHGDDLLYLFDFHYLFGKSIGENDDEIMMKETITELWYNFVAIGDPTPEKTNLLPNKWVPMEKTGQDLSTFYINGPQNLMIMKQIEETESNAEYSFWENLPIAHNPDREIFSELTKSSWTNYIKNFFKKISKGINNIFG